MRGRLDRLNGLVRKRLIRRKCRRTRVMWKSNGNRWLSSWRESVLRRSPRFKDTNMANAHSPPQQSIVAACSIRLSPRRIFYGLTVITICLAVFGVAVQLAKYLLHSDSGFGFARLFDLDGEGNVPAWYSSALLLLCAVSLAVIWNAKTLARDPYAIHWRFLAILFLFMSLDETAAIHERLTIPVRSAINASGVLYYAWVVPMMGAVVVIGLAYLRFLAALPHKIRKMVVLAGTIYIGSALGLELVEGYWATAYGEDNLPLRLIEALEDVGEMFGLVVFLYALMSYVRTHFAEVRIQIGASTMSS